MANSPAGSVIDVGSVIADTYKIEALIGRGGMGAVFVASHARLPGKKVAIKLLHAELVGEEILARFRREAEIASRLGHPNIVAVHDFNVMPDGTPYLVLDYLEGQTLAQRLKEGPIPLDQIMSIVRQIGSALAAAHREGIVHRDLKPQNIFLIGTEVDGRMVEIAKVLDFGISKIVGSQTVKTQESTLLGTPQYMAPEQATGQHDSVDQRTDVFALGSIVYEMLNGHPAFSGASIPEVVFKVVYEQPAPMSPEVPSTVADAVRQAMAKPAAERFATVGGFVEALTGVALTNFRPSMSVLPEVGLATGSKRISNHDALANTMGSGDFTPPPPIAPVSGAVVRGSSPTVDSTSRPIDVGTTPTSAPPAPAKKPWALVAAVIFGAIAAAAVTIVVLGGSDKPATSTSAAPGPEVAVVTPADKVEVAASGQPKAAALTGSGDTGAGPPVATQTDTTPDPGTPDPGTPDPGNPDSTKQQKAVAQTPVTQKPVAQKPVAQKPAKPDTLGGHTAGRQPTDDDGTARDHLQRAEAALISGDTAEASRLASAVINSADAKPGQQGRAHSIKGVIACRKNRDPELAAAAVRQIRGARTMKLRVIKACHEVGIELEQR